MEEKHLLQLRLRKGYKMQKRFVLFLAVLILASSFVSAASPVLFFSDLTSGPNTGGQNNKGVFVTVVGKNFGSSRGTSYITVGNGQAHNYPVWTDTKITFQLGANAQTGDVVVHTSEGNSNGLPFTVRAGRIFFVDDTSPNNPGSGTYEDPWRSPKSFYDVQSAGDTCYFRAGTYSGAYRSGTSNYNMNFDNAHGIGVEGNEIAWVSYPSEQAIFDATGAGAVMGGNFVFGNLIDYYIVISGFICKSLDRSCFGYYGNHIRTVDNDCIGSSSFSYARINPLGGNHLMIYGNSIHGSANGNKLEHPLYIGYGSDNVDFGWNRIYDNNVGAGPIISVNQDYAISNHYKFENINIHDNIIDCRKPSGGYSRAIGFLGQDRGSSSKFYNNIVIECGGELYWDYALYILSGSVDVYHNTFYNIIRQDRGYAFHIYKYDQGNGVDIYIPETVRFYNNIIHTIDDVGDDYFLIENENEMVSLDISSNLYYGDSNGPVRDMHAVNADPLFVDSANDDFHLESSSPAIDAGYDTSAIVAKDFDGISRPRGSAYDIGAYEYIIQNFHAADTNNNGKIEMIELIAFIARWKNAEVNVNDVISALDRWFKGG